MFILVSLNCFYIGFHMMNFYVLISKLTVVQGTYEMHIVQTSPIRMHSPGNVCGYGLFLSLVYPVVH